MSLHDPADDFEDELDGELPEDELFSEDEKEMDSKKTEEVTTGKATQSPGTSRRSLEAYLERKRLRDELGSIYDEDIEDSCEDDM